MSRQINLRMCQTVEIAVVYMFFILKTKYPY